MALAAVLVQEGLERVELAGPPSLPSAFGLPGLRSEHARTSNRVPPDMMVIVAHEGKIFHVAGCPFIHDKSNLRSVRAREAEKEGYAPCVRCMKKYLESGAVVRSNDDILENVAGSEEQDQKSE